MIELADMSMPRMERLFGAKLEDPIRIVLYNDFTEFSTWMEYIGEFYTGVAMPELGLTVQTAPDDDHLALRLASVIPHEISHLYYYQAGHHPIMALPNWVDEGLAQYHELVDNRGQQDWLLETMQAGKWIPLKGLAGGFGNVNEERVDLSYAESLSAILYLEETYGREAIARLIAANRAGKDNQMAFSEAFNRTLEEIEQDWLAWLGIDPAATATPTPLPAGAVAGLRRTPASLLLVFSCGGLSGIGILLTGWGIYRRWRKPTGIMPGK